MTVFDKGPVAIVGGGLIGMSWAALFLAKGARVVICDSDPQVEDKAAAFIRRAWPDMVDLEIAHEVTPRTDYRFTMDIADACNGAAFIQESGPERLEIKRAMVAEMEETAASDIVIASSTSSLLASDLQQHVKHPERIITGHPINPPHLVPAVEVVRGRLTSERTAAAATEVYAELLGRVVLNVKKEVVGHLINRLNSALYREAVHLVAEGIADVENVDKAVAHGLGLRWGLMGPHLLYHLGGGEGGYRAYLDHFAVTQQARWAELGALSHIDEDLKEKLVAGLRESLRWTEEEALRDGRDKSLVALQKIKRRHLPSL